MIESAISHGFTGTGIQRLSNYFMGVGIYKEYGREFECWHSCEDKRVTLMPFFCLILKVNCLKSLRNAASSPVRA